MGVFGLFGEKEAAVPKKMVELAVFSLGSEANLYRLSEHLGTVFGNPAWERFAGRRSLVFVLDEGELAAEIPYKLSVRLFEDGGGFVRLELDLAEHSFETDAGLLWHRRELSSALTRFLEAALSSRDPEALKHAPGAEAALARLGIVPERIAGELDFGFTPGSTLIKIGVLPDGGDTLAHGPEVVLKDRVFFVELEDGATLHELERWVYREGAAAWHRLSLRRWLERMDDVRTSLAKTHTRDFARFLRRVNRFLMRERRFGSTRLPVGYLEQSSEFTLLAEDFDPTSRRLSEIFSARQEDAVDATLRELKRLSFKQERLFAAWVVLVAVAGLFIGVLQLLFPGASWLWMIGAGAMVLFPLGAYYLWAALRGKPRPSPGREERLSALEERRLRLAELLSQLERDESVPQEFREELLTKIRRELARLERLGAEEKTASNGRR